MLWVTRTKRDQFRRSRGTLTNPSPGRSGRIPKPVARVSKRALSCRTDNSRIVGSTEGETQPAPVCARQPSFLQVSCSISSPPSCLSFR
jgi:hypothetical protein